MGEKQICAAFEKQLAAALTDGNGHRKTAWLASQLVCYEEVSSTNTAAMRLAREGAAHGTLVTAECQTAGKGRHGRTWLSAEGAALAMSIILKLESLRVERAPQLTLVAALAVARAIERQSGLSAQIKWPNDLVLDGKKVCGILTEMQLLSDKEAVEKTGGDAAYKAVLVVGIGINVNNTEFSQELSACATSLRLAGGRCVDRAALIAEVCVQLEHFYEIFLRTQDMSILMEAYNHCLVNRGRTVRVLDPKGAYEGIARGITAQGALEVETADGCVRVDSGEVSVRGVYGYV